MDNLDDSAVLATEDGKTTLTLGEAKANESVRPVQERVKMLAMSYKTGAPLRTIK